jgi:hypothetical protein
MRIRGDYPMTALIPLAIKYGIPGATYLIGHLIGFIHGKHAAKKAGTQLAAFASQLANDRAEGSAIKKYLDTQPPRP